MDYVPPPSHIEYNIEDSEAIKAQAMQFMDRVEGWCSYEKAFTLIDIVLAKRPQKIVEIGVWGGKSMIPMACALKKLGSGIVYGIDSWDSAVSVDGALDPRNREWWGKVDHQAVMYDLIRKINAFDLDEQIMLIRNTSESAPLITEIDLLHIDANHSEKASLSDVQKWVPLVKKGGLIIFADLNWCENGVYTTSRAVEWLNTNCTQLEIYTDNCDWGIWQKQ